MAKKVTTKKATGGVVLKNLHLSSLRSTRRTYARILRLYASKKIRSRLFFRDLIYALSRYAELFKMEVTEDLSKRLDEIEKRLDQTEGKSSYAELRETS